MTPLKLTPATDRHHRLPTWRRQWLTIVWLLTLALLLLAACRADREAWERIQQSGVLRVGVDPTFPPFALDDGGTLTGIDIDLARALAAEMGLTAQFTYFGYDGLYDALTTEQVDVLISALVVAPERMGDFAYSDTYYDAGQALIIPADSAGITSADELEGQRLAVELGALGHVEALALQRARPSLSVQTYGGVNEALDAVAAGEADGALVDGVSGRLYLKERPATARPLLRLPQPVTTEPYAVVVRIEDRTLLAEINGALQRLSAAGELDAILNRWLGP